MTTHVKFIENAILMLQTDPFIIGVEFHDRTSIKKLRKMARSSGNHIVQEPGSQTTYRLYRGVVDDHIIQRKVRKNVSRKRQV